MIIIVIGGGGGGFGLGFFILFAIAYQHPWIFEFFGWILAGIFILGGLLFVLVSRGAILVGVATWILSLCGWLLFTYWLEDIFLGLGIFNIITGLTGLILPVIIGIYMASLFYHISEKICDNVKSAVLGVFSIAFLNLGVSVALFASTAYIFLEGLI